MGDAGLVRGGGGGLGLREYDHVRVECDMYPAARYHV